MSNDGTLLPPNFGTPPPSSSSPAPNQQQQAPKQHQASAQPTPPQLPSLDQQLDITPEDPAHIPTSTPSTGPQTTSVRPYRSRRNRPCDFCRRRKTRCDMLPEGICAMCKKINGHCTFVAQPAKKKKIEQRDSPRPIPARSHNININNNNGKDKPNTKAAKVPPPKKPLPPVIDVPPFQQPPLKVEQEKEPPLVPEGFDSAALLGLSGDQDPYLLQYYNYDHNQNFTFIKHSVRRVNSDPAFPVQFLAFRDSERDSKFEEEVKSQRKRIYEKVNKLEERLLALYFRFAYPTYPIVDREGFYHDYYHNKDNINVGVLAGLLALSCIWWKYDSLLCVNVMPKNLANELFEECAIAVKRESKYPTIASVQCLLLLLQRRLQPSDNAETFEMTVDIAKLVAISQNLGLHLDPSNWSIADSAKRLRKRLWTTVYIMEKWTTINVGRPSMLHWNDSTMGEYTSEEHSAQLFVQMCRLTTLLDEIAQDLYSIRHQTDRMYNPDSNQLWERVAYYFSKLEDWRNRLPEDLKDMQVAPEGEFCKNGTLGLAALTVEAMLHKIRLHSVCVPGRSINSEQLTEFRAQASETIQRVIKFTSEITHSHLHAFWYSTTRLNFSTVAHFMYFHHITSPTRQEYRDTREVLRKWLFALRVLSQGWEEGTGLAALRMDTVFWMGNDLFNDQTPGLNGEMEQEFENELHGAPGSGNHPNISGHNIMGPVPEPHPDHHQHQPHHHHQQQLHHHHQSHPMDLPQSMPVPQQPVYGPHLEPNMDQIAYYNVGQQPYPIADPEPLDHDNDMLLLNEDIMPQEEQTHLLEEDVPENLQDAYAEYFSNDRFHDEGFLTQDLHELFQVHTNSGLTPDPTFV